MVKCCISLIQQASETTKHDLVNPSRGRGTRCEHQVARQPSCDLQSPVACKPGGHQCLHPCHRQHAGRLRTNTTCNQKPSVMTKILHDPMYFNTDNYCHSSISFGIWGHAGFLSSTVAKPPVPFLSASLQGATAREASRAGFGGSTTISSSWALW